MSTYDQFQISGGSGSLGNGSFSYVVPVATTTTAAPQFNTLSGATISYPHSPRPLKSQYCETFGHVMADEVDWAGGDVLGKCGACGERISGRRIPGGFGLEQVRELVEDALDDNGDLTDLCVEVVRLTEMLDRERRALEDAQVLLKLARAKLAARSSNFD